MFYLCNKITSLIVNVMLLLLLFLITRPLLRNGGEDHEREKIKVDESRTLVRERGRSERGHGEERVDSAVKEGTFQQGKSGQARRASLEQVEGSMSG